VAPRKTPENKAKTPSLHAKAASENRHRNPRCPENWMTLVSKNPEESAEFTESAIDFYEKVSSISATRKSAMNAEMQ
jgi:hypothetical protein